MPPLEGPRAMLCVTRYPSKTVTEPSSIVTGIETSTDFLHRSRTLIRFGSIAKVFPTRRSCSRAISYGFSRRWVGTSAVVIRLLPAWLARWRAGVYLRRGSANPEADDLRLGRPFRGERHDAQLVHAVRKRAPARASASQP